MCNKSREQNPSINLGEAEVGICGLWPGLTRKRCGEVVDPIFVQNWPFYPHHCDPSLDYRNCFPIQATVLEFNWRNFPIPVNNYINPLSLLDHSPTQKRKALRTAVETRTCFVLAQLSVPPGSELDWIANKVYLLTISVPALYTV
jgi:hypothetical protein